MPEELAPDICVVGGGPGGIAAASAAAAAGVSVILVEKGALGGGCLTAAVPSKALIAAADTYEALRIGPSLGVSGAPLQVNLNRVRDHIVAATTEFARALTPERLAVTGIQVIQGEARFVDHATVAVGERVIRARRFILAVGLQPAPPKLPGLDGVETMTFADAFQLDRRPSHLIILGASRYALELAQGYARLGIDATIVSTGAPLAGEDPELVAVVVDRLRAEGIRVRANVAVHNIARRRNGVRILLSDPADAEADGAEIALDGSHLLVASAGVAATAALGLAAAEIAVDGSGIAVDGNLRTSNGRVYAIGDAVKGTRSVARAELQARSVVRSILYRVPRKGDDWLAPRVAFTDPGFATVGLTEAAARARYGDVEVLRLPLAENARAHIERQTSGLVKVVATRGGRVLGAGIVGRDAAELIAPWALAVANRLTLAAVEATLAAFPTRAALGSAVARLDPEKEAAGLTAAARRRIIALLRKFG
jgi:pyruvate/2-oxoglutarate dehydrogenase complex dihydrolipoamide dehydrogenase (E3) component